MGVAAWDGLTRREAIGFGVGWARVGLGLRLAERRGWAGAKGVNSDVWPCILRIVTETILVGAIGAGQCGYTK